MKQVILLFLFLANCTSYELSGYDPYEKQHQYGKFGMRLFDKQDYNQDGFITLDELASQSQAIFDLVDTNLDGRMTYEEAKIAERENDYLSFGPITQKGYITFDELFAPEQKRFWHIDKNHDQKISRIEFKKHYLATFNAIRK